MFRKVLIANRGAIACRIIRTLKAMGIVSVAVYSEADRHALHVLQADEAIAIGSSPAAESYLKADAILDAVKKSAAEAIHPGYGFLSENPDFAEACENAGIVFIGPTAAHMRAFGLKHKARELALAAGVPLAPGSGLIRDVGHARSEAQRIGYPVMLKSTAGGGGIGLQLVSSADEIAPMFERVERLARNNFKDAGVFIEKYVARGRHIEVQIFGDGTGTRRRARRTRLLRSTAKSKGRRGDARAELAATGRAPRFGRRRRASVQSVNYESAGTVEFLYDAQTDEFYFLEVNTRLQVEHGVTEEVTGVDLVEWMIRQAAGETLPLEQTHDQAERRIDPGSALRRRPGPRFPPKLRAAYRGCVVARCAHRDVGAERIGSFAVLRSDAGEDHRQRRDASRRAFEIASGARRDTHRRARDKSRLFAPAFAFRCLYARRDSDADRCKLLRIRPTRSKSFRPERRRQSRIGPDVSAIGPSACRLPGRWTRYRSVWRTGSSATMKAPQGSRRRSPGPTLKFNTRLRRLPRGCGTRRDARRRARSLLAGRSRSKTGKF